MATRATENNCSQRKIPVWALAIKGRRVSLGLRQEDILNHLGEPLKQSWLSDLERGKTELSNAAFSRVVALAKALEWTLEELQKMTGLDLGLPPTKVTHCELGGTKLHPVYELQDINNMQTAKPLNIRIPMPSESVVANVKFFHENEMILMVRRLEKPILEVGKEYVFSQNKHILFGKYKLFSGLGFFIIADTAEMVLAGAVYIIGPIYLRIASILYQKSKY